MARKSSRLARLFRRLFSGYYLKVFIALLVLGAVAALFGPKVYRHFREQRIEANLESARVASRSYDWQNARSLARSVLIARPGDFEAFRIFHQASAEISDPQTYMVSAQLFVDERGSVEDKLAAFRVLCQQAPQAVALSAFASLDEDTRDDIDFRAAMVPFLLHRGEPGIAEGLLRESANLADSALARLELIRVLCATPNGPRIREARGILADLIRENRHEALEAIILLGNAPGGLAPGEPLPDLPAWVATRSEASTLQHLFALHPSLSAADASRRDAIFQDAIDRFLAVDPGTVGNWLVSHGLGERVVHLLESHAETSATAYISRLRAMMRHAPPEEVDAALASPPLAADMVDLEIIRTTVAFRRGNAAEVKAGWDRVLHQATFDQSRNRFLEIFQFAALLGSPEVANDAMVAAIRVGWGRIPLYMDLQPVILRLAEQNRTADLLAVYRTLLRFEPDNPELLNNILYLGMLHEVTTPEEAATRLEALLALHPELEGIRSSLAVALLFADEPERALALLPEEGSASDIFSPAIAQAIRGAAYLALQREDEGRALIQTLNWNGMFRQEARALRSHISSLRVRDVALPDASDPSVALDPEETPAWRRAVEALERQRADDVLPPLPPPRMPAEYDLPGAPIQTPGPAENPSDPENF